MLTDLFNNKKGFKLICGAGNEDVVEIEKLVFLYAKAGCRFFDICAKESVIKAAKQGIEKANTNEKCYLCISVGAESDQHFCKARIDINKCIQCNSCKNICPQNAVEQDKEFLKVNTIRCIGCKKCIEVCPMHCINLIQTKTDLKEILPPLIKEGIDCIEFHVLGNENDIYRRWDEINNLFDGTLSISINRSFLGDERLFEVVKSMLEVRKPYTTIIQADGIPMSGGENDYHTTLQAIATADFFKSKKLSAYIIASGGTNEKTSELAKLCNVDIDGVAIGSYARKIVKEYISRNDFWENETIKKEALNITTNLVKSVSRVPLKTSIF